MFENNAQVMELSNLLSGKLLSFCGDFDTDDDIDVKSVDPSDEASNLFRV